MGVDTTAAAAAAGDDVTPMERSAALAEIASGQPERMAGAILAIAVHDPDRFVAEETCIRYSGHVSETVRGGAILGLRHIARMRGIASMGHLVPILNHALQDPSPLVRMQACGAMDDLIECCGMRN